jgi:hypothetical protein
VKLLEAAPRALTPLALVAAALALGPALLMALAFLAGVVPGVYGVIMLLAGSAAAGLLGRAE